jgi:glyoxylase-like metal-dependent hydrolase (beta-lactamase superfamily II)
MSYANVRLLRPVRISNVWLFSDDQGHRFLIDTGDVVERPMLWGCLARWGVRRKGDLTAVLLTHRHRDHAGNAAWLRRTYDAPVICHQDDAPQLEGQVRPRPLSDRPIPLHHKALCFLEDRRPAVCPVDETFDEGPWKWGFEVVHVPGHTEGTVMLYHRPTRTLFSGDAIVAGIPPLRLFDHLLLAKFEYSLDVELCHNKVRGFLNSPPQIDRLCPGHGPAMTRNVPARLSELRN